MTTTFHEPETEIVAEADACECVAAVLRLQALLTPASERGDLSVEADDLDAEADVLRDCAAPVAPACDVEEAARAGRRAWGLQSLAHPRAWFQSVECALVAL